MYVWACHEVGWATAAHTQYFFTVADTRTRSQSSIYTHSLIFICTFALTYLTVSYLFAFTNTFTPTIDTTPADGTQKDVVGNELGHLVAMSPCIDAQQQSSGSAPALTVKKGGTLSLESWYYAGSNDTRLVGPRFYVWMHLQV